MRSMSVADSIIGGVIVVPEGPDRKLGNIRFSAAEIGELFAQ